MNKNGNHIYSFRNQKLTPGNVNFSSSVCSCSRLRRSVSVRSKTPGSLKTTPASSDNLIWGCHSNLQFPMFSNLWKVTSVWPLHLKKNNNNCSMWDTVSQTFLLDLGWRRSGGISIPPSQPYSASLLSAKYIYLSGISRHCILTPISVHVSIPNSLLP